MSRMMKRLLSLAVAAVLVFGMIPGVSAEGTVVATVGDTGYATLEAAIENAGADDVITMQADYTLSGISIAKDLAINLGQYTVTGLEDCLAEGYCTYQKYGKACYLYIGEKKAAPEATVEELTNLSIHTTDKSWGMSQNEDLTLDVGYVFKAKHDENGALESQYSAYHADFVVYADQDIAANTIALAGQYDAFDDGWVVLSSAYTKGSQIRLLKDGMGVTMNYLELCRTVKEFQCGAMDISGTGALDGVTLTVELRLYPVEYHLWGTTTWNTESDEDPITIGTYSYTFGEEETIGAKVGTIRYETVVDGKSYYALAILSGIDSLNYKEVGFIVTTSDGKTATVSTNTVYESYGVTMSGEPVTLTPDKFSTEDYTANYIFYQRFLFGVDYAKENGVTYKAYAVTLDGETIYGAEYSFDTIYQDAK